MSFAISSPTPPRRAGAVAGERLQGELSGAVEVGGLPRDPGEHLGREFSAQPVVGAQHGGQGAGRRCCHQERTRQLDLARGVHEDALEAHLAVVPTRARGERVRQLRHDGQELVGVHACFTAVQQHGGEGRPRGSVRHHEQRGALMYVDGA